VASDPKALAERLRECVQVFDVCRAHRPLNPEALADAGDWLGNAATEAAAALLREPERDRERLAALICEWNEGDTTHQPTEEELRLADFILARLGADRGK
jgi:hypothetical protein